MYNKRRQELQTPHEWLLLFLLHLFEHFPAILRLSCPRDLDSPLHGSYPPIRGIDFLAALGMAITGQL